MSEEERKRYAEAVRAAAQNLNDAVMRAEAAGVSVALTVSESRSGVHVVNPEVFPLRATSEPGD